MKINCAGVCVAIAFFLSMGVACAGGLDFQSKYFAARLSPNAPAFSFFSVDSLGGGRLDQNPMLAETNFVPGLKLENDFTYKLGGRAVWLVRFSERTLTLRSDYSAGVEAPPFVLTFNQRTNHATLLGLMKPDTRQMNLPCVLHLPDMGTLRITGDGALDYDARRFVKPAFVRVAFPPATAERKHVEYKLEVTTIYPKLPGLENNPRYDGFRRDWLERRPGGGLPRGASSPFRIEQDQLIVAAPSIRREASHGLPSRVRETLQQPVVDRGWRGAGDAQTSDQMRQRQRDELARTRPPNLPEKTLLPATSVTPPPALGRVLQPDERIGAGGRQTEPRHVTEEVRPTTPLSANTPPGIPNRKIEESINGGFVPQPGLPHREHRAEGMEPGMRPGQNIAPQGATPNFPQGPQGGKPQSGVPAQSVPNAPAMQPGFPGHQAPPPRHFPEQQSVVPHPAAPVAPPHVNQAPMPPPHPQPPAFHPQPPQGGNATHAAPVAPPHNAPPTNPVPQNPGFRREKR